MTDIKLLLTFVKNDKIPPQTTKGKTCPVYKWAPVTHSKGMSSSATSFHIQYHSSTNFHKRMPPAHAYLRNMPPLRSINTEASIQKHSGHRKGVQRNSTHGGNRAKRGRNRRIEGKEATVEPLWNTTTLLPPLHGLLLFQY